jgi:Tfp pilus assembly protein PilV
LGRSGDWSSDVCSSDLRDIRFYRHGNGKMYTTIKKRPAKIFRRQCRKALTLPEVVVAASLLLVALVPILKALTQVNMNSVIIERRTQSLCLAQAKLDQIQAQSVYNFDGAASQNNEVLSGSYLCNTTVSSVSSNLKSITVCVGMDRNADESLAEDEIEITLQTQIARRW